jgi:hypothetical protein
MSRADVSIAHRLEPHLLERQITLFTRAGFTSSMAAETLIMAAFQHMVDVAFPYAIDGLMVKAALQDLNVSQLTWENARPEQRLRDEIGTKISNRPIAIGLHDRTSKATTGEPCA